LEGRNSKIFGISGLIDVEIVNAPGTTKANNAAFPQFEDDPGLRMVAMSDNSRNRQDCNFLRLLSGECC